MSQSTQTSPSLGQSPFSHRSSDSQTTRTTPSPAHRPSKPAKSGLQTTKTKSRRARGPSNPTNSGTPTASTTSGPATNPPTRKARVRLTAAQKLDRHKRAEAVRRNRVGKDYNNLRDEWTPRAFKLPVKKWNCKKESLIAAANWLEQLQKGNNELEEFYNALTDVHSLITDGFPTAQTQLQLPSPPLSLSQSSPYQQQQQPPAAAPQLPFPNYDPRDYINHQPISLFPQQQANPTPPPQPNQGYPYYPPRPQDDLMVPEEEFMRMR